MKLLLKAKYCGLFILICWITIPAFSQTRFKYKTALQKIDSNGFYSITLQPGLTAKCSPHLRDIRLINEKGDQAPYLLGNTLLMRGHSTYQSLLKVVPESSADSLTSYIAENKAGVSIDQLWIKLQNTAVNRTLNLLGSDDLKHWFAIKEHIIFQPTFKGNSGTYEVLLNFPVSTYRYFKIQINDGKRAPVHILEAGIYLKQQVTADYTQLPVDRFITEGSADTSIINITFNDSYRINKLQLEFAGTKYYHRRVQLYSITGKSKEWLTDTLISSVGSHELYISAKTSKLQLLILNEDNPPLLLKAVRAYQLKQSLVAYLEKQHRYELYFGNDKVSAPRYDLQFFADSINAKLPDISHSQILETSKSKSYKNKDSVPTSILWIAGGLALLGLLALTLRMTKEISQIKS